MKFRVWDKKANCYMDENSDIPIQDFWIDYLGSLYYSEPARDGKGYLLRVAKNFICEYSSGAVDINGKEIYEGDILAETNDKFIPFSYFLVKFTNFIDVHPNDTFQRGVRVTNYLGFCLVDTRTLKLFEERRLAPSLLSAFHLPVVGNIHQNPELLEI